MEGIEKMIVKTNKYMLVILIAIIILGLTINKYINHEKRQNEQINSLVGQVAFMNDKFRQFTDYYDFQPKYRNDAYNYLAIGNSITVVSSWGHGMSASSTDNDYYSIVCAWLAKNKGEVVSYRYNFATWEKVEDRSKTLGLIDVLLDDKLNLVSIQLGENVNNIKHYDEDLKYLIEYIRERAPKAQIIIVGDFWSKNRNDIRRNVAESAGVSFADLSMVINNKSYEAKVGDTCILSDGKKITITSQQATHPGDSGMKYISDKIISRIE